MEALCQVCGKPIDNREQRMAGMASRVKRKTCGRVMCREAWKNKKRRESKAKQKAQLVRPQAA